MIARHAAVALVVVRSTINQSCNHVGAGASSDGRSSRLAREREQLLRNALRSDLRLAQLEVTTKRSADGCAASAPEMRRFVDLRLFATKPQICTYLRLGHVAIVLRYLGPGYVDRGVALAVSHFTLTRDY